MHSCSLFHLRNSLLLALTTFVLGGCTSFIKTQVPDVPICRHLDTRPQTKIINGQTFTVQRPNPMCMKAIGEARCGFCVYSVSEKQTYVGDKWNHLLLVAGKKKTWSTIQEEAMTVPAESQAATKAFAVNVCKATKSCGQEIDRWRLKLDSLDSIARQFKK